MKAGKSLKRNFSLQETILRTWTVGRYCILLAKDEAGITPDASSVIIYLMLNIDIILSRVALSHTPLHFLSLLHLRWMLRKQKVNEIFNWKLQSCDPDQEQNFRSGSSDQWAQNRQHPEITEYSNFTHKRRSEFPFQLRCNVDFWGHLILLEM